MTKSTILLQPIIFQQLEDASKNTSSRDMLECVYVVAGKSLPILHIVFFQNFIFDCILTFN
jgi:hypothetical protein